MQQLFMAVAFIAAAAFTLPAIGTSPGVGGPRPTVSELAAHIAIPTTLENGTTAPRQRAHATLTNHVVTAAVAPAATTGVSVTIGSCFADTGGSVESVRTVSSTLGVGGTTRDDLDQFARAFNSIRVAHCLPPIALANFHSNTCMQQRLFWMAEDPSEDPLSAWGHLGSQRSDGLPSVGCDGNLAGGSDNTGATVAQKWWDSLPHRAALYRPNDAIGDICIVFAMTHGGVPDEPSSFTRAAARWVTCNELP